MNAAVGHYGTFDFQRSRDSAVTRRSTRNTDASNVAVGAYLYGAGFPGSIANAIEDTFSHLFSSNAGDPNQG